MTPIQNRLFDMLDEIDSICMNNNLKYFITGRLAVNAYLNGAVDSGNWIFSIFMPYNDILHLQDVVNSGIYENREIESVYTNEDYAEFTFRYVDSSSLYLQMEESATARKCHGIFIEIHPLYANYKSKLDQQASRYERFWRLYNQDYPKPCRDVGGKGVMRLKRKLAVATIKANKSKYHQKMLECRKKSQNNFDISSELYFERMNYTKIKIVPAKLLVDCKRYPIEGHEYCMPADAEKYLDIAIGKNWKNKNYTKKIAKLYCAASAEVPYKEFMSKVSCDDMGALFAKKEGVEAELRELERPVTHAWNIVQRSGARIALANHYAAIKNDVIEADKKNDWERLRSLLSFYDEYELQFEQKGIAICFDREILDIYIKLLRHDNQDKRADKMLASIPEQHLNSSIS